MYINFFYVIICLYNSKEGNEVNNEESKIKFYSIDGNKIDDLSTNDETLVINEEKKVKTSTGFDKALKIVIEKDINVLSNKLNKIISEITKRLVVLNVTINLSNNINDIDKIVDEVDKIVSDLIIKKSSIKIGIFSSNKKEKKSQIKNLDDAINFVSKCQNELISIKKEYCKLKERNEGLTGFEYEEEEKNEEKKEADPLERTINFYMTKEN